MKVYIIAASLLELQLLSSLTLRECHQWVCRFFALITNRTETPSGFVGSGVDSAATSSSSSCDTPPAPKHILKVCTFWKRSTVPLCPVHLSIPTRNRSPEASDGDPESQTYGRSSLALEAALGEPEESLNFQYWTCCEVGPAPCDFDRRLHTNSCRKQAKKTRPSSEMFLSSVSSRYQLPAVSNKDTWERFIFTGCTSLHDGNSVQLCVRFLSLVVFSLLFKNFLHVIFCLATAIITGNWSAL